MKNTNKEKGIDIVALGDHIDSLIEIISVEELKGEKGDILLKIIEPIDEYRQKYDI